MQTELKPCPFCGFIPDVQDDDCIYPVRNYIIDPNSSDLTDRVWTLVCYVSGGGCDASVLGDFREDVIRKWNTRV
jgi:hypothetical protein